MELTRIKSFHPDQMGSLFLGGNLPGEKHQPGAIQPKHERFFLRTARQAHARRVVDDESDGHEGSASVSAMPSMSGLGCLDFLDGGFCHGIESKCPSAASAVSSSCADFWAGAPLD